MPNKKGSTVAPDRETLKGFLKSGKTIDWISEKWNVTPQTVRSWFSKFNLKLPPRTKMKTSYSRKAKIEKRSCPVCQCSDVNYLIVEKHWLCLRCDTEFDKDNVIYIYDERGELIEVISSKPGIWDTLKLGKTGKGLIRTITV